LRKKASSTAFVVCAGNTGYPASLEFRKIYEVIPDPPAALVNQVRIADESGEDYLYPQELFVPVELPPSTAEALALSVSSPAE